MHHAVAAFGNVVGLTCRNSSAQAPPYPDPNGARSSPESQHDARGAASALAPLPAGVRSTLHGQLLLFLFDQPHGDRQHVERFGNQLCASRAEPAGIPDAPSRRRTASRREPNRAVPC